MKNYNSIGKIVATYGFKGELVLKHHLGNSGSLKDLKTIFVEMKKDELLPYFIESLKSRKEDELLLKIEGIDTKEAGRPLLQKQVWLAEDEFHRFADASAPVSLLGFHIFHKGKDLGEILEIIEQPHQLLCRIDINGKEALIPVHDQTLEQIDKKKKKVVVNLPEGLIEVFTGE